MKIDVLRSPGCAACERELGSLHSAACATEPNVDWRELDILQALDYAVELGVLKAPAVAIDGVLVFTSLPTREALTAAMRQRLVVAN